MLDTSTMEPFPYPDSYNFQKTDMLINREWFGDRDDIREILDRADQDAWEKVNLNIKKYPAEVQDAIRSYYSPFHNVKDITDKQFENIQKNRRALSNARFEAAWEKVKGDLPTRPLTDVDTENDEAWNQVTVAKMALQTHMANRKYKAKGTTDAKLKVLEDKIKEAETEYERTNKDVAWWDERFTANQKSEFYKEWVCEL